MGKNNEQKEIFGKEITNIGTANTLEEFISLIRSKGNDTKDSTLFFRGEARDYGETALHPQLFRKTEWIKNEHKMIKNFEAKFPADFPKGTSTFDIMVTGDHFSLPVRLLDISYSALTGLFMASKSHETEDGFVYISKVPKDDVKNWNSDTVTLISNLARMDANFPCPKGWLNGINDLVHKIKDEKPDFYKIYEDAKIKKYKKDLRKIVCVESKMLNTRIINQKGLFFLFGINGKKKDFEKLRFDKKVEIYSIRILSSAKDNILKQLEICGYDKMTIFPDMQNVCENIKENY